MKDHRYNVVHGPADDGPHEEYSAVCPKRKMAPMLSVTHDLLAALAAGLEHIAPGSGDKAAFESPKVAAHGDLATTVAM